MKKASLALSAYILVVVLLCTTVVESQEEKEEKTLFPALQGCKWGYVNQGGESYHHAPIR